MLIVAKPRTDASIFGTSSEQAGGGRRGPPLRQLGNLGVLVESPSLLIADDDRFLRETLEAVFRPRGFRTLLAADGEEAIRIVHRDEVHLVLLDMHMPKLTGLEAIHLTKQHKARLPCILMSAGLDDLIRAQAERADACCVLAKPIRVAELTDLVGQIMRLTYDWPQAP